MKDRWQADRLIQVVKETVRIWHNCGTYEVPHHPHRFQQYRRDSVGSDILERSR